jgi:hypothetical protein
MCDYRELMIFGVRPIKELDADAGTEKPCGIG